MSIHHIFEAARYPYHEVGLIGRVVSYDLRSYENYLNDYLLLHTSVHGAKSRLFAKTGHRTRGHIPLGHAMETPSR